jgi:sugar phosphate isomerase/epimerase
MTLPTTSVKWEGTWWPPILPIIRARRTSISALYGTIDWDAVIKALHEIKYTGDLTYECMFFNQHLPLELKRQAIRQARIVGEYLLSRAP